MTDTLPIFSFLIYSHQNAERCESLLHSIVEIAQSPCEILVATHTNDPQNTLYVPIVEQYNASLHPIPLISSTYAINRLTMLSSGKYIIPLGDDVDIDMEASLSLLPDVLECGDLYKDDIFCIFGVNGNDNKRKPIVPRKVIDLLGYLYCPIFCDSKWCDYWIGSIMFDLNRCMTTDSFKFIFRPELIIDPWFNSENSINRDLEFLTYRDTANVRRRLVEELSAFCFK